MSLNQQNTTYIFVYTCMVVQVSMYVAMKTDGGWEWIKSRCTLATSWVGYTCRHRRTHTHTHTHTHTIHAHTHTHKSMYKNSETFVHDVCLIYTHIHRTHTHTQHMHTHRCLHIRGLLTLPYAVASDQTNDKRKVKNRPTISQTNTLTTKSQEAKCT